MEDLRERKDKNKVSQIALILISIQIIVADFLQSQCDDFYIINHQLSIVGIGGSFGHKEAFCIYITRFRIVYWDLIEIRAGK